MACESLLPSFMKRLSVSLCLLLLLASSPAEEQTRSTQEELRRRNLYFGDIDGRPSPELSEAVKRYQKRKGLSPSGQTDHDTLRSLGLAAQDPNEPPPRPILKEASLPDLPVLKSDERLNVKEVVQEIAAETGVAPESITLAKPETPTRTEKTSATKGSSPAPNPAPRPQSRFRGVSGPRLSPSSSRELPRQVQDFVRSYVKAVGRNRLENELQFYADTVQYFGAGWVDRRIVEQTLRKYYQRWPSRHYTVLTPVSSQWKAEKGEIVVTYQVRFNLRSRRAKAQGLTENRIVINAATADPRIVSISERRVRR